jgi:hypothetical protein
LLGSAASGNPVALNVQLTGGLSLEGKGEPLIEASRAGEGADLGLEGANCFVLGNIFVEHLEDHIVSDVLDVEFKGLVPDGDLTSVLLDNSLESFVSVVDDREGVHLAEELSVSSQLSFHDREVKSAL